MKGVTTNDKNDASISCSVAIVKLLQTGLSNTKYEVHFPASNLPVLELVARQLPSQSSELVTMKPEMWFSKDEPSTAE